MTTETASTISGGSKFLRALGWLAKFILRLLFVVVIGILLGGGIYWGVTYGVGTLNQRVLQPIQDHAQRLDDLESRHTQDYGRLNERTQALQEQTQALQEEIQSLQKQSNALQETVDTLKTHLAVTESLMVELQTTLKDVQESLSALENRQSTLGPEVTKLRTALKTLQTTVDNLTATVTQTVTTVEGLSLIVKDETPLLGVRAEVQLLKAMELLTRARLELTQNNLGAATTEVQEARELLLTLNATVPPYQQSALTAIVQRLDLGLANLPNAPRLAADDFEIAWQLLKQGLPAFSATETLTATTILTATTPLTPTVTPTP